MPRRRLRTVSRLASLATTGALALLYLANLPFYSGASLTSNCSYRLEHGRLTLKRSPVQSRESFYIDFNSEGLRFAWDAHYSSPADWTVTIPLWAPLALSIAWTVSAWRPRRAPGTCPCGYARSGLPPAAPCPECGRKFGQVPSP